MGRLFAIFSLAVIIALSAPVNFGAEEKLNIYAVNYGKSSFSNRFIYYGDRSGTTSNFCWLLYYIEYGSKKILVDTGFNNKKMASMFGIKDFKDPVNILVENKIQPESITDIIITHSHFDHIGNVNRFKNARIFIQKHELAYLNKDKQLVEIKKFMAGNKNVTVFDDAITVYEKFRIKNIGGHTKGSSVVFFEQNNKKFCFTGDEVYLNDNLVKNKGNGSVVDHKKNTDFINDLKRDNHTLFIFHDSRYFNSAQSFIKVFPQQ